MILVLDAATLFLLYSAIKQLSKGFNGYSFAFLLIDLLVLVCVVITTVKTLKNGVIFKENELEFTALDENNVLEYKNIKKAESHKDTKVSFKKKFTDRYSSLIIYLNDDTVLTVELGFTSKKKLKRLVDEINKRANAERD